MPEVEVWTTVDVELTDFSDEQLLDELDRRGLGAESADSVADLIREIYQKRRLNKDYQRELDQLIYRVTGRLL